MVIEDTNMYVRFNGYQSIFLSLIATAVWIACWIVDVIINAASDNYRVYIVGLIWFFLMVTLHILMTIRGYVGVEKNELTILPLVGNWAYNQTYGKGAMNKEHQVEDPNA